MQRGSKVYKYLRPLSWVYGTGVWIRNKFFDMNILRSEEFVVPLISIGNLSVGGTGKTPHTEYLIRLLQRDYRVAVLSRGYKRKSSGFVLANNQATSERIGDESYQLYRKFPKILVAVDHDRRRGIRKLLSIPKEIRPEVILLDDAYQHRYIKPSLSILLTEFNRPFFKDTLLPAGRLREPANNKNRADIVVVTKSPSSLNNEVVFQLSKELDLNPNQKLFISSFKYSLLQAVFPDLSGLDREEKIPDSVLLFAGIASPLPLIDYLKQSIPNLAIKLFPDHYSYTRSDFDQLLSLFNKGKDQKKILITTEKDAVKLVDRSDFPKELKKHTFYLPIEVVFHSTKKEIFNQIIKDHVATIRRNRKLA